ncbi:hypothetical protein LCGC14_1510840 [marine sediment metagenome]|uniref:Uncharacterized protein n=1 Tax=marine sediment metagenome TaxID=412755 RepID=A0A0F9J1P7_9ZZZZ
MKEYMDKLIQWYKKNYYSQGDAYYISYSPSNDRWLIGYSNDYPDGKGEHVRLRSEQVDKIINEQILP